MAKCLLISFVACVVYLAGAFAFVDDKIVGGRPGNILEFPYQISFRRSYNDTHFCGGSLIRPCHILTAAHCMFYNWGGIVPPGTVSAVAGQNDLKLTGDSNWRNASEIYIHAEYDKEMKSNDIAIVKLKECFPLGKHNIAVADYNRKTPPENTSCVISGWGVTKFEDENSSDKLLAANVSIISRKMCQSMYSDPKHRLFPTMMCTENSDGSKDACQGDSGGPLFCNSKLAGIVSTSIGCANAEYPGIYTDISHYLPWIQSVLDGKCDRCI